MPSAHVRVCRAHQHLERNPEEGQPDDQTAQTNPRFFYVQRIEFSSSSWSVVRRQSPRRHSGVRGLLGSPFPPAVYIFHRWALIDGSNFYRTACSYTRQPPHSL